MMNKNMRQTGHGVLHDQVDLIAWTVLDHSIQLEKLDKIETILLEHTRKFDHIDQRFDRLESKLDAVVVSQEDRIVVLEKARRWWSF